MNPLMIAEHLFLVTVTLVFALIFGLPLGICAYLNPKSRRYILWFSELMQTIPALALLGVIMVVAGAGKTTVIIGLTLYALLPVVHNTYLGLSEVSLPIKEVAVGMGMTAFYRLFHVELPIAFPVIFTGIRMATITSVGAAAFATFVGGGGLGSVIYQGIRTQNIKMILGGTLSLMFMAVIIDGAMGFVENRLHRHRIS